MGTVAASRAGGISPSSSRTASPDRYRRKCCSALDQRAGCVQIRLSDLQVQHSNCASASDNRFHVDGCAGKSHGFTLLNSLAHCSRLDSVDQHSRRTGRGLPARGVRRHARALKPPPGTCRYFTGTFRLGRSPSSRTMKNRSSTSRRTAISSNWTTARPDTSVVVTIRNGMRSPSTSR